MRRRSWLLHVGPIHSSLLVSTYVVCERLSDAKASCSGINLCSKIPDYPSILGPEYPLSPQKKELCPGHGTLSFDHPRIPPSHPPPPKLKFGLGVSGCSYVETNFCIPRGYHLVIFLSRSLQEAGFSGFVT